MLIVLVIVQTLLIVWLLARTPTHTLLQHTFDLTWPHNARRLKLNSD